MESKHDKHFREITEDLTENAKNRVEENINDIRAAINEFFMLGEDHLQCIEVSKEEGVSHEFIDKIMNNNRKRLEIYTCLNS